MHLFSSLLFDVYVQLNIFRTSSRPSLGAQQLQEQPLVLPLERGGSSAVGRGIKGFKNTQKLHTVSIRIITEIAIRKEVEGSKLTCFKYFHSNFLLTLGNIFTLTVRLAAVQLV